MAQAEKVQYEDLPARFEYHLTDKGRELLPVILTMMAWGDKWEADKAGAPVELQHLTCGSQDMHARVTCSDCSEESNSDVLTDPIPVKGARQLPNLLSAAAH